MDFSDTRSKIFLAVVVVAVLVVGYFLWANSAPPAAEPLPGQSISNPFGSKEPGHAKGPKANANRPQTP